MDSHSRLRSSDWLPFQTYLKELYEWVSKRMIPDPKEGLSNGWHLFREHNLRWGGDGSQRRL